MSTASSTTQAGGPDWGRLERLALLVAFVGVVVFIAVAISPLAGPHGLMQSSISYLVAANFLLTVPMGCLSILMIQYLTGGSWGVLLRPILESSTRTMVLLLLLFLPVIGISFLGASSPYPWARPLEQVASEKFLEELREKTAFLNPSFFLVRTLVYFGSWLVLVYFLRSWSARWHAGSESAGRWLPSISGPGLVFYGISITFAAIDWIMSLEPFWKSTMYPPIYAIGQILSGFAFAIIVVVLLSRYPPLAGRVTPKLLRDLGGLMLVFVMLWAYMSFSQFLLMWIGNLSDEVPYYMKRMRGGWEWVGVGLIALHFAIPFVALLYRDVKERPNLLLAVALMVLVMRFVDVLWWIEPAFPHDEGPGLYWLLDVAAALALGGVWCWWFLGGLSRISLAPVPGADQCEVRRDHA